ncbi:glycosyltransferase family 4 protein [Bradyrhizobium sp. dw_411]|uniref:glycosyltransferase family 4 protein n=1 Tax=Bradyrhizobium sp. dw_411 TaxID=2720082 RepID=UPI001BCB02AC|nr:glycosyltransferase family 4 protein [Bradyrhizobium sp. dw_411]
MQKPEKIAPKIIIASQHYPPDQSTTAAIMSAISTQLARDAPVLVLSGMAGSATIQSDRAGQFDVVEVKNRLPGKAALVRRATSEMLFAIRIFRALLTRLQPGDVALTVTAPFMLPYAVVAAARLKRARSVLIMHDLYPDVLVMAGLLKPASLVTRGIRGINALMFRGLNAIVTIGRDTEQLLLRYAGVTRDKLRFIPNWATLAPAVRPISPDNPYRRSQAARFIVGLSGNLGFTHDPDIVFAAARLLRDDPDIHFLLSGWGIGFERLKQMQAQTVLPNVSLVDRVPDENLEAFLSAADLWLIPYRKNVAGVSVPSRFYNLLAVGRPVLIVAERDAEAALTVTEHDVGWVVTPGDADELARTIRLAASSEDFARGERAATIAQRFNFAGAMAGYSDLVQGLLRKSESGR